MSIKKRLFHKNEAIVASCKRAKEGSGRLHLIGLVRSENTVYSGTRLTANINAGL